MKKPIGVLFGLILITSCGKPPAEFEKVYEDGVEVVLNRQKPYVVKGEPSGLVLERELAIDAERADLLEAGLADIGRFDVDSQGRVYLVQSPRKNECLIFQLDDQGRLLKSFARTGAGPGEIQYPAYFGVNSRDDVLVFDNRSYKLLTFGTSGDLVGETLIPKARNGCLPLENGNFMATEAPDRPTGELTEIFVSLFDPEFEKIKTFSRFEVVSDPETAGKINLYPPYPIGAVTPDRIFLGYFGRNYEILVYNLEGSLLRKIRKDYEPVPVTEGFRQGILHRAPKGNPIVDRIYFPANKPAFQSLFADETGRLFVVTSETDEASGQNVCDIFSRDGVFISRAPIGYFDIVRTFWEGLTLGTVAKRGRIYSLREKENGYKELVVSRAVWR